MAFKYENEHWEKMFGKDAYVADFRPTTARGRDYFRAVVLGAMFGIIESETLEPEAAMRVLKNIRDAYKQLVEEVWP